MTVALMSSSKIPSQNEVEGWAKALKKLRPKFLDAVRDDTSKGRAEVLLYEWSAVESSLEFLKRNSNSILGTRVLQSSLSGLLGRRSVQERRLPLGKVLIVGTWNYPLAIHGRQILFALAAGNEVYFKPSPLAPNVAKIFDEAFRGELKQNFQVLAHENTSPMKDLENGRYDFVVFTGGYDAACSWSQAAATSLTPGIYEASGSELAIVAGKGNYSAIVDQLLWSNFHYSGQTCMAPRTIFVPRPEFQAFLSLFRSKFGEMRLEDMAPLKGSSVEAHRIWLESLKATKNVHLVHHSDNSNFVMAFCETCEFCPPESLTPGFGPGVLILGYEKIEEVLNWKSKHKWSLMTSLYGSFTKDEKVLLQDGLMDSVVSQNESIIGASDASVAFGGRMRSGYGYCGGVDGLMSLSRPQSWIDVQPLPGQRVLGLGPGLRGQRVLKRLEKLIMGESK